MECKKSKPKGVWIFQKCHEGAILNSEIKKVSKNKQVTLKHRPEVNERASHEGNSKCKGPGVRQCTR